MTLKIVASLLLGASFYVSTLPVAGDDIVYSDSTTKLNNYYAPGNDSNGDGFQFGDQIVLAGTTRNLSTFTFEYFLPIASGNESVRLRFYYETSANDPTPGVKFFDSGYFHIDGSGVNAQGQPDGATLRYDFVNDPDFNSTIIVLPDTFTWTVQFSGVDAGETAGLELYSGPTVGKNYDEFWQLNTSTGQWQLRVSDNGTPMNFGAIVTAVPEASPLMIATLAGAVWLVLRGLRHKLAKA